MLRPVAASFYGNINGRHKVRKVRLFLSEMQLDSFLEICDKSLMNHNNKQRHSLLLPCEVNIE
jgi:hypothetical protein